MVVVCEPITVRLNTCPPPEHWSWYSVITPFGLTGGCQVNSMNVELGLKRNFSTFSGTMKFSFYMSHAENFHIPSSFVV